MNKATNEICMMGNGLRFISWNVKGINGPVKKGRVFSHLKHLKTEIAFLQETHLSIKDHCRLKKSWVSQLFNSLQFTPKDKVSDPQGRFIIVSGSLSNTVCLANVYAPNWDNEAFIHKIISFLLDLNSYHLILGGALNCAIEPLLDKSHPKQTLPSKMAKAILTFIDQIGCMALHVPHYQKNVFLLSCS